MFKLCKALNAAVSLVAASGSMAAPKLVGTWQGTIDNKAVMVCLTESLGSSFYFMKDRKAHPLRGEALKWEESPGSENSWSLDMPHVQRLTGQRSIADQGEPETIKLHHIESPVDLEACGPCFYAPLHKAEHVIRRPANFRGHHFDVLSTSRAKALLLPDSQLASQRFNSFGRTWLKRQTQNAYDCEAFGGDWKGVRLEPILWNAHWLVVKEQMPYTYCGGLHGNANIQHFTFDAANGNKINTWNWLRSGEEAAFGAAEGQRALHLRQLVESHAKDLGCEDHSGASLDAPYPTRAGLVFSASQGHGDMCLEDIHVPWRALKPHLTQAGHGAMRRALTPVPGLPAATPTTP